MFEIKDKSLLQAQSGKRDHETPSLQGRDLAQLLNQKGVSLRDIRV